jgi:hypothetical protein
MWSQTKIVYDVPDAQTTQSLTTIAGQVESERSTPLRSIENNQKYPLKFQGWGTLVNINLSNAV